MYKPIQLILIGEITRLGTFNFDRCYRSYKNSVFLQGNSNKTAPLKQVERCMILLFYF